MYRPDPVNGTTATEQVVGAANTTHYGSRTLSSLPPLSALSTNTVQNSWTRRSKSSAQSDESFSAYLHHPFSSSPAIDRGGQFEAGRLSAQRETPRSSTNIGHGMHQHRRLPSLDTVGHAHERSSPYAVRPTPQRSSLRDVLAMHGHERSASRYVRTFSTPSWRGNSGGESNMELLQLRDASPWHVDHYHDHQESNTSRPNNAQDVVDSAFGMGAEDEDGEDDGAEDGDDDDTMDMSVSLNNTQESSGDLSFLSEDKDKKRRRRTNRNEARVLSAVFEKTAFPDQATREALADRLRMSVRSVSIWFQNRRQAVKKRASRFGGLEGVCGAVHNESDEPVSLMDSHLAKQHGHQRLKRWLSLDEVAARTHLLPSKSSVPKTSGQDNSTAALSPECMRPSDQLRISVAAVSATSEKSCAPILDLLRKRATGKTLTRIASMPCFAATFGQPGRQTMQEEGPKKDLRRVLDDIAIVRPTTSCRPAVLARSTSMLSLPSEPSTDDGEASIANDENVPALEPLDVASKAPIGLTADPSTAPPDPDQLRRREIWKRMKSSSSGISSENNTPESDKENRQIKDGPALADEDGYEDEEQTLRRIAMRRASKQEAKREQRLSVEGAKYVLEADARLVLQQKRDSNGKHSITDTHTNTVRQPLAPLPVGRTISRSTSEGMPLARRGLLRVPSLDFEAGRDRSKEVERPVISAMTLHDRLRLHAARSRPHNRGQAGKSDRAQANATGRRSLPTTFGTRTFKSVKSMPVKSLTAVTQRGVTADDSSSAISLDSRTPSEASSAEWADEWSRDQAGRSADGPSWRTSKRKSLDIVLAAVLHDDSGFFGSDEASDDGQDENADPSAATGFNKRKRRTEAIVHGESKRTPLKSIGLQHRLGQQSSSPLKRGDERDRLAAETLLAFGSFA